MQEDLILVQFFWHCGRMGDVDGLFVTKQSHLDNAIGKEVYFGEILGKHSEIYGTLKSEDFEVKSTDQDFIKKLIDLLGSHISGYNPLTYLQHEDEE